MRLDKKLGNTAAMRLFLVLSLIVVLCFGVFSQTSQTNRDKARYYYIEGVIKREYGSNAEAHLLFQKAVEADTTYVEAKAAFAESLFLFDDLEEERFNDAVEMMRVAVDRYPDDLYNSKYYAYVASKLKNYDEAIRVYSRVYEKNPDATNMLIQLADNYYLKGEMQKAYDCYTKYEQIEGRSVHITHKKMVLCLNMKDSIGAIAELDSLITDFPRSAEPLLLKSYVMQYLNRTDSVLPILHKAERLEPENGEVKVSLAEYYQMMGDSVACDNKMYEALMCDNYDIDAKLNILAEYLQKLIDDKSGYGRGNQLFVALQEQYQREPKILDLSARYNAAVGDMDSAIEAISYAIDMSPDTEDYWNQKIAYLIGCDRNEEAIATFTAAEEYIVPSDELKYLITVSYVMIKKYDVAIDIYSQLINGLGESLPLDKVIEDNSLLYDFSYEMLLSLSQYYMSLGDVYNDMSQYDKGQIAYENSLKACPNNIMTLNNYAYMLTKMDANLDKAETMIEKAISYDFENVSYLDTYAWVLFRKGDYELALLYMTAAVELEGDAPSAEVWHHYGDVLFFNNQHNKAVDAWKMSLELDPENKLLQRKVSQKTYFE